MQLKGRIFSRLFRPSNQRRCSSRIWTYQGLARPQSRPWFCPACYWCGNTHPATLSGCFEYGFLDVCQNVFFNIHSLLFLSAKTYLMAASDKGSFKYHNIKDGRTCNRTLFYIESTDGHSRSKRNLTVGIS